MVGITVLVWFPKMSEEMVVVEILELCLKFKR
jgi:hypothetical protein